MKGKYAGPTMGPFLINALALIGDAIENGMTFTIGDVLPYTVYAHELSSGEVDLYGIAYWPHPYSEEVNLPQNWAVDIFVPEDYFSKEFFSDAADERIINLNAKKIVLIGPERNGSVEEMRKATHDYIINECDRIMGKEEQMVKYKPDMELQNFSYEPECEACGSTSISTRYTKGGAGLLTINQELVSTVEYEEFLIRTCNTCQYEWLEKTIRAS